MGPLHGHLSRGGGWPLLTLVHPHFHSCVQNWVICSSILEWVTHNIAYSGVVRHTVCNYTAYSVQQYIICKIQYSLQNEVISSRKHTVRGTMEHSGVCNVTHTFCILCCTFPIPHPFCWLCYTLIQAISFCRPCCTICIPHCLILYDFLHILYSTLCHSVPWARHVQNRKICFVSYIFCKLLI